MTKNGTNIEKRIEEIEAEIRELKEEKKCLEHDLKALSEGKKLPVQLSLNFD